MFQRHGKVRQAGFIRRHDLSKRKSTQVVREETQFEDQNSLEFSPFKDLSPQPIQRILETHRQKTIHNFEEPTLNFAEYTQYTESRQRRQTKKRQKKQKQHSHKKHKNILPSVPSIKQLKMMRDVRQVNHSKIPSLSMKEIQNLEYNHQRFQRYETTTEQARNTIALTATESVEQIQEIQHRPEQIHLSLAESFNLNCRRMKQRLERERVRFSKTKNNSRHREERSRSYDNLNHRPSFSATQKIKVNNQSRESTQNHLPAKLFHRNSDGETKKRQCRDFSNDNKQNCEENANMRQKIETPRPSNDQKATKFFIPAPTSRSKPITPQQAYQHSLKKWKQLPQVVAREKEKEKQAEMRQRISKMKAHDIQVRRSLKR